MEPAGGLSNGRAELCGGAFAALQEDGTGPAASEAEVAFLGCRRERLARVGTDALDHRAQTIGALRRQVLAESELIEDRDRIGCQDFARGTARIEREQDCDQTPDDMGIAVAEVVQHRLVAAIAIDPLRQPDLTDAALNLVDGGMLGLWHRFEGTAEFDDVPVAVVPILQQRKIVPDLVDAHDGPWA